MSHEPPSTRRDVRYPLRGGRSSVEIPDPRAPGARTTAELVIASAAGIAFHLEARPADFVPGAPVERITVSVGECRFEGSATVRNTHPLDGGRLEVGCLFYPTAGDEDRWMTLIEGIRAATPA